MSRLNRSLEAAICASILFVSACEMGPPRVSGVAAAPPSPNVPWKAPPGAVKPEALITQATAAGVPPDLAQRIQQLSLADVVDLALRNNPATRASWAQARAAADLLGSARGQYYPTIDGDVSVTRSKVPTTSAINSGQRTVYGPSVSLNYLLLDFGGRSGSIERARQTL